MTAIWLALTGAVKNIVVKVVSEKFFTWLIFWAADMLVKSTKTKYDDVWLAKVKELHAEG